MLKLETVTERIVEAHGLIPTERCALVAISGIDASGKGYLAAKIADDLGARGVRVALVNIDGWLNLQAGSSTTTHGCPRSLCFHPHRRRILSQASGIKRTTTSLINLEREE